MTPPLRPDQAEPYAQTEALAATGLEYFDVVVVVGVKRLDTGWTVHAHTRGSAPDEVIPSIVRAMRDTALKVERGEVDEGSALQ